MEHGTVRSFWSSKNTFSISNLLKRYFTSPVTDLHRKTWFVTGIYPATSRVCRRAETKFDNCLHYINVYVHIYSKSTTLHDSRLRLSGLLNDNNSSREMRVNPFWFIASPFHNNGGQKPPTDYSTFPRNECWKRLKIKFTFGDPNQQIQTTRCVVSHIT